MENSPSIRKPAVAGSFYPSQKTQLEDVILHFLKQEKPCIDKHKIDGLILGAIIPHAGIKYCAAQAVHFFEVFRKSLQQVDTVVIFHPDHYGSGHPVSADNHDLWETPSGVLKVDNQLVKHLHLPPYNKIQQQEHSAEVIVPYLQFFLKPGFRITTICISQQNHENALFIAEKLYNAQKQLNRRLLVIASSDFSHFLKPEEGKLRDDKVIEQIVRRNAPGVQQAVSENNASVCGFGPIMALMEYCRLKSPRWSAKVLRQGDSGGDISSGKVVRYVSMLMEIQMVKNINN